jgi:PAS domain S-box-containing protein
MTASEKASSRIDMQLRANKRSLDVHWFIAYPNHTRMEDRATKMSSYNMNKDHQLPHDLSQRLRLLDVLDQITQVSLASENMEEALSGVLDLVLEIFNADRAWFLYPCDPEAPSWGVPMERTRPEWPGLAALGKEIAINRDVSEIFCELLSTSGTIQYGPHADHSLPSISVEQFSVKSQLQIVLRPKIGKPWLLGLHHCVSEVMHDEEDLHLFTAIAHRISDTLSVFISTRQLSESEVKFRTLYDSTSDAVMLLGENGFIDCNRATLAIFGCASLEEFCSKHPADFSPPEQPCGTDSMTLANQRIATAMEKGSHFFEWAHKRADTDGNFPAEVLLSAMELDGKQVIQATVRDITERKHAEGLLLKSSEEIKDLYNNAPCGYHSLDKDGIIRRINDTELAWLGYTRDEVIGKIKWPELITSASQQIFLEDFPRLIKQGFINELEIEIIRKDGTIFTGLINATSIYDSSGDFVMSRSTLINIDGRKLAELQLHNLTAHIQTVREEEKVGISREIHDDLGGTLTALKMEAHWLKSELSANKETTPLLDHAEAMSQLIDSATATMRNIVTGLRPTILDDLGLLAALEWQAEQFQKRTGIKCLINCIGNKGNLDNQHSIALFRISQEALTNVLRHAEATRVEIEYHHSDEEIVMSIIDNGRGMTKNNADASICYGIHGMRERVDQLGGKIDFDIPPGGGFNVTVILPLPASEVEKT